MSQEKTLKAIASVAVVVAVAAIGGVYEQYNTSQALIAELARSEADQAQLRQQLAAVEASAHQATVQADAAQPAMQPDAQISQIASPTWNK